MLAGLPCIQIIQQLVVYYSGRIAQGQLSVLTCFTYSIHEPIGVWRVTEGSLHMNAMQFQSSRAGHLSSGTLISAWQGWSAWQWCSSGSKRSLLILLQNFGTQGLCSIDDAEKRIG